MKDKTPDEYVFCSKCEINPCECNKTPEERFDEFLPMSSDKQVIHGYKMLTRGKLKQFLTEEINRARQEEGDKLKKISDNPVLLFNVVITSKKQKEIEEILEYYKTRPDETARFASMIIDGFELDKTEEDVRREVIDCLPEKVSENEDRDDYCDGDINGFNNCREQFLSNLKDKNL